MLRSKVSLPLLLAALLSACSFEGVSEAKTACVSEIQNKLNVDVSASPSSWSSFAGTGGKGTTFTFTQTSNVPGVVCQTSGGKVVALTKSETMVVK
ncbi:MAG: hypothetical protein ACSHXY_13215 [Alphaproteobacteria bacterium]